MPLPSAPSRPALCLPSCLPQKVKTYILETIASDPGLQQTELVFLGLFGRACRVLEAAVPQVIERAAGVAAAARDGTG
jgi:MoxR-like ATPase